MADQFWTFLKGPVGSLLRVFLSVVLGFWLADLLKEGSLHWDAAEWQIWLGTGVATVLPVILAWLNPKDLRFGRKS